MSLSPDKLSVLLSYGFRPFFLLALTLAVFFLPFWLAAFFGWADFAGPFTSLDWHIHEMVFGYTSAVIAGFLFTAIPNWTGRPPVDGWPLAVLATLWLGGRLVMLGVGNVGPIAAMIADCGFMAAVLAVALREVIAGKNWRNLMVAAPLSLYLAANVLFHYEVMEHGVADVGRRLGLATVVFLITLIGGRIIPAFSRNWMQTQGKTALPVQFNKFDGVCVLGGAAAMLSWSAMPDAQITAGLLIMASGLHFIRLSRWRGLQTLAAPILLILHLAYAFVPVGFMALGAGSSAAGIHLLGIGAIGGMTVSVMIRATAGHTGRALIMSPLLYLGFLLIPSAAIVRALASVLDGFYQPALVLSGALWVIGFAIVLAGIGRWLCLPGVTQAPTGSS